VDYDLRQSLLDRFGDGPLPAEVREWQDGAVKQAVIRRALGLRRRRPELFSEGAYVPLTVRGPRAAHALAFARALGDVQVVVAVPLLTMRMWPDNLAQPPLGAAWRGSHVEAPRRGGHGGGAGAGGTARYRDLLSGRVIEAVNRRGSQVLPLAEVFASFRLALLETEGSD